MNRKYLYLTVSLIIYALGVWIIIKYFINELSEALVCGLPCIVLGLLIGAVIDGYISSLYPDFLYTPFADLRKWTGVLIEKREKIQEQMLVKMQYLPFPTAMQDIEEIFRKNKNLKLHRFKIFRAWYKHYKLREKRDPEFYQKLLDLGMTPLELDPYFDPNAPDWEQFALAIDYGEYEDDEYDDDEDEDDFSDNSNNKNESAADWFYGGIGFGAVNSIFSGSDTGGNSN